MYVVVRVFVYINIAPQEVGALAQIRLCVAMRGVAQSQRSYERTESRSEHVSK